MESKNGREEKNQEIAVMLRKMSGNNTNNV